MADHYRIALATPHYPESPKEAVDKAVAMIREAGARSASIICFPECFIPGYRGLGKEPLAPDTSFLRSAWTEIAEAARLAGIVVILGTERIVDAELRISVLVINADGTEQGYQDKVQLDPSEETLYTPGDTRRVFQSGDLCFGVAICHEGFRYPETVRWAARSGAHIVFHPHYSNELEGGSRPTTFAAQDNTFHEKALLCRAAENTCFLATINYAAAGSPTTTAVIDPQGNVIAFQPYGVEGILYADLDLSLATGRLAKRFKPASVTAV